MSLCRSLPIFLPSNDGEFKTLTLWPTTDEVLDLLYTSSVNSFLRDDWIYSRRSSSPYADFGKFYFNDLKL